MNVTQSEVAETEDPQRPERPAPIALNKFLEEYPLNSIQRVLEYAVREEGSSSRVKATPQLKLWCAKCEGYRHFYGQWEGSKYAPDVGKWSLEFLKYFCRNCGETRRIFCVAAVRFSESDASIVKIGEIPESHIELPSYLPTLLGTDYAYFVKGLKAEKRGLGIGAFGYYRRVVERQRERLFDHIAKVAKRVEAPKNVLEAIETARREAQFKKAVDALNDLDLIPDALRVDGHNPLKLLHSALSIGLHEEDDDKCLQLAHSVRLVLQDLAVRIKDALREETELHGAISALMQLEQSAKSTLTGEKSKSQKRIKDGET